MSSGPAPMPAATPAAPRSLRWRLLALTVVALVPALLLAHAGLSALFREHVQRQFTDALTVQLDALTARLDIDAQGRPVLAAAAGDDPRWSRPYSGHYWQLDQPGACAPPQDCREPVLRSRSLWDTTLQSPPDALADGERHVHELSGPQGVPLLVVERSLRLQPEGAGPWRLLVAADRRVMEEATARFGRVLAGSLGGLLVLLVLAAWAQVHVGLAPLRALGTALAELRGGRQTQLHGRFPAEVQPLVDDFNAVLAQQAQGLQRARAQAGNLAHALKTPLAVLGQAAAQAAPHPLAQVVDEQVAQARRQVDLHLARARAAAAHATPGLRTPVMPVLDSLLRVMQRLHAARALACHSQAADSGIAFAGEAQDLQEMLGNLLDNAHRWARSRVDVQLQMQPAPPGEATEALLRLTVDDDGPGIEAQARQRALQRGQRLDESLPGSGLGLAIVAELATLYGGRLELHDSPSGGLRAVLLLPLAR